MNKIILFFCIILFTDFCFGQATKDSSIAEHYTTDRFDIAIFPATSMDLLPGAQRFTPSKPEIEKAEKALATKLIDINSDRQNQYDTPVIDKNLKKYKRQYFGYIDSNGNKVLLINCFWKRDKDNLHDWLKEKINVLDGGSYFWNVKYNINKDELSDLEVNGGI